MIPTGWYRERRWVRTGVLAIAAGALMVWSPQGWFIAEIYLAAWIAWVWLPDSAKTGRVLAAFFGLSVASLVVLGQNPSWRSITWTLMMPYAGLLAARPLPLKWAMAGLATLGLARAATVGSSWNLMMGDGLTLVAIFAGVLSARIRRESRALDRRRMTELEQAYRELTQAHRQLRETALEVAEARAREERYRLAADIHDGVGHRLTSLVIGLESLAMMLPDDVEQARGRLPALIGTARQALADVREAVHARQAAEEAWDRRSLERLVKTAAEHGRWQTAVSLEAEPERWPAPVRRVVFRVLQEALTNILRHAQATAVRVSVVQRFDSVEMTIVDDGVASGTIQPGYGMAQIEQRCRSVGGQVGWRVLDPHGLELSARVPIRAVQEA
jgi:signal transduction histidine kinase